MIGIGVTAAAALITVLFSPPVSPASPPPLLPSSPPLASFGPTDSRDYGRGSAGLSAYAAAGHPVLGLQDYGFSEGQCTWFVASVVPESQNPCPKETTGRNALNWLGFARAKGMPIGDEPLPGAIMCLRASGSGHVAVVLAITADTVTVADANWHAPPDRRVRIHDLSRSRPDLQGYIFAQPSPSPPTPPSL